MDPYVAIAQQKCYLLLAESSSKIKDRKKVTDQPMRKDE